MHEITVNGERYVKAADCGEIKIVILERGFVFVGRHCCDGDEIVMRDARCLIRWGTQRHLGQLVNGPLDDTTLGDRCTVRARHNQVIGTIEVNQDGWIKHIA